MTFIVNRSLDIQTWFEKLDSSYWLTFFYATRQSYIRLFVGCNIISILYESHVFFFWIQLSVKNLIQRRIDFLLHIRQTTCIHQPIFRTDRCCECVPVIRMYHNSPCSWFEKSCSEPGKCFGILTFCILPNVIFDEEKMSKSITLIY